MHRFDLFLGFLNGSLGHLAAPLIDLLPPSHREPLRESHPPGRQLHSGAQEVTAGFVAEDLLLVGFNLAQYGLRPGTEQDFPGLAERCRLCHGAPPFSRHRQGLQTFLGRGNQLGQPDPSLVPAGLLLLQLRERPHRALQIGLGLGQPLL